MTARRARWKALAPAQKRQLLVLATVLPIAGLLIRLLGFRRTARTFEALAGTSPLRPANAQDLADAQSLASLAGIAGRRGPITTTCLRQAVVLRTWLRRRGLDAQLKIGVRKRGAVMDAHAWVELEGVALAQKEQNHRAFPVVDLGSGDIG